MLKVCLSLFLMLHFSGAICFSMTDEQHKTFMKDGIYSSSFSLYTKKCNELKETFGKIVAEKIDSVETGYLSKGIENDVAYFKKTQPFYNDARTYANALFGRANAMWNFIDNFVEKKEVTSKVEKLMETGDIVQADPKLYINMLDSIHLHINRGLKNDESMLGIINSNHLYCTYDNYENLSDFMIGFAGGLLESVTGYTGASYDLLSGMGRQEISCRYWGNLKQYSIGYFYKGLSERYFTQETEQADRSTEFEGIAFSSTTIKSTLEYVSVRLDIEGKNGVEKFFYAFGIDKANKQLVPIDPNTFLNEIASRYKPS